MSDDCSTVEQYPSFTLDLKDEGQCSPQYRYCLKREISTQTDLPARGRRPFLGRKSGGKKTEEKDKFWLRAFRADMKKEFLHFKGTLSPSDRSFWRDYLSPAGQPERSLKYNSPRFRSYGKQYKDYLFSHQSFSSRFRTWLDAKGREEVQRKFTQDEDLRRVMWEYASECLAAYDGAGNGESMVEDGEWTAGYVS